MDVTAGIIYTKYRLFVKEIMIKKNYDLSFVRVSPGP
jgi:hypothetical protein